MCYLATAANDSEFSAYSVLKRKYFYDVFGFVNFFFLFFVFFFLVFFFNELENPILFINFCKDRFKFDVMTMVHGLLLKARTLFHNHRFHFFYKVVKRGKQFPCIALKEPRTN